MRLWLSDKAQKALNDVPEAMKNLGKPEGAAPADAAEKERKRAEEAAAREAKKGAKKELKEGTAKADDALADALTAAQGLSVKVRELEHKLGERRKDAKHSKTAVEDAERRVEEAQKLLERTKKELARAEADVPTLEAQFNTETATFGAAKDTLQKALVEADGAWRAVHPRLRKKRDRRSRHAAVQIVGAQPEEPSADEAEGNDAEGQPAADAPPTT